MWKNYLMKISVCLLSLFVVPAFAHDNVRIGVLSIQQVEVQSVAWNEAVAQFEQEFEQQRKSILEKDQTLQKEVNQYQQQRPLLSPEQQQTRDQEMNQKITELQNLAAQETSSLDEKSLLARQALRLQIARLIEQISQEKNLDLILEISEENFSIVFSATRLDLTEEVISRLNSSYPKIILE